MLDVAERPSSLLYSTEKGLCLSSKSGSQKAPELLPIDLTLYTTEVFLLASSYTTNLSLPHRQVIMSGCVAFAKMSGSTRVESELLPQMWEQVLS